MNPAIFQFLTICLFHTHASKLTRRNPPPKHTHTHTPTHKEERKNKRLTWLKEAMQNSVYCLGGGLSVQITAAMWHRMLVNFTNGNTWSSVTFRCSYLQPGEVWSIKPSGKAFLFLNEISHFNQHLPFYLRPKIHEETRWKLKQNSGEIADRPCVTYLQ